MPEKPKDTIDIALEIAYPSCTENREVIKDKIKELIEEGMENVRETGNHSIKYRIPGEKADTISPSSEWVKKRFIK